MPGPITHLKTAYFILEKGIASASQPEQFFLGSISPDSVNVNGHAAKEIRWPAHLRNKDLNLWLENVKSFWKNESTNVGERSFVLGYIIHIITDIVWDMYFEKELWVYFESVSIPRELWKAERWNELYGYERLQVCLPWFKEEVCPLLLSSVPQAVGSLNCSQVAELRDNTVGLELPEGHLPRFVDDRLMDRFYGKVAEVFVTVVSDLN